MRILSHVSADQDIVGFRHGRSAGPFRNDAGAKSARGVRSYLILQRRRK